MYSPPLGRFLSRDPLPLNGEPDVLTDGDWFGDRLTMMKHLYGYVDNNPLGFVDPSGLEFEATFEYVRHLRATALGVTIPKMKLVAECVRCDDSYCWRIELKQFLITTHMKIRTHFYRTWKRRRGRFFLLGTILGFGRSLEGSTPYQMSPEMINKTIAHESIHEQAFRRFHNEHKKAIEADFNTECNYEDRTESEKILPERLEYWRSKYDDVRRVQGDHSDWVFRAHREMWKKALAYYKEHKTVPIGDEFGNSPLQYEDE